MKRARWDFLSYMFLKFWLDASLHFPEPSSTCVSTWAWPLQPLQYISNQNWQFQAGYEWRLCGPALKHCGSSSRPPCSRVSHKPNTHHLICALHCVLFTVQSVLCILHCTCTCHCVSLLLPNALSALHSALCTMKHNGALPSHVCTCAVRPAFSQSVIIHHSYLLHSLQCAPEQLIPAQCSILKITVLFYIAFYIHKTWKMRV